MDKIDIYTERLERVQQDIGSQLSRITRLQEILREEEEKLYSYLQQEKNLMIALFS